MSDGPPTASMREVQADLTKEINKQLAAFRTLKSKDVQELNDLIRSEISDFIKLKKPDIQP